MNDDCHFLEGDENLLSNDERCDAHGITSENISADDPNLIIDNKKAILRLYIYHCLTTWTINMHEFAMALLLISIWPNSLILPSAYEFSLAASALLTSPAMGKIVDTKPRYSVARSSLIVTKLSFICAGACAVLLLKSHITAGPIRLNNSKIEQGNGAFWSSIAVLILCATCGRVSYHCNQLSIEKDWIKSIFTDHAQLAIINSILRRIDLVCKLLSPMVGGVIMTYVGISNGAIIISFATLIFLVPELFLLSKLYSVFMPLLQREIRSSFWRLKDMFEAVIAIHIGWKTYRKHSVFSPGLGLAMLYGSVLNLSSILVAYCFYRGMTEAFLGGVRSISAIFGIGSTIFFPMMYKRFGIVRIGLYSIWSMIACLVLCIVAAIVAYPNDANCSGVSEDSGGVDRCHQRRLQELSLLLTGVTTTRFGLWLFDLTVTQQLQEWVSQSEIGVINGVQVSLQMVFSLIPPTAGMILASPTQFRILVIGSFIFVLSAGLVYCRFFLHVSHQSTSATSFVLEISSESNNQTTSIELPTISPETPVFFDDVNAEDNKAAEATLLLHTFSEQNLQ